MNLEILFLIVLDAKEKRPELKTGVYYCEIVSDSPMKGIVTGDIDGTECVEKRFYLPL